MAAREAGSIWKTILNALNMFIMPESFILKSEHFFDTHIRMFAPSFSFGRQNDQNDHQN
jgi:hypothetical protein